MPDTATTAPPIPAEYTAPHTLTFWGQQHTVTPAVAEAHLGDGRLLLAVTCANTRPNYYLVRVDSTFFSAGEGGRDGIDAVIDALADEFGELENERELLAEELLDAGIEPDGDATDLAGNEARLGWPVLSLDSGYYWGHVADL